MKLYMMSMVLGSLPPPSYQVTIPPSREWVYESAAWVFAAMAIAAGGLWYARRRTLRPVLRRTMLWLMAGSVAVAYSAGWLWVHRDGNIVPPHLIASLAVWMHGVWAVGAAVVVLVGWRHVWGTSACPGWIARAGRPLAFAIVTIALGSLAAILDFRWAFLVFVPGIIVDQYMKTSELSLLVATGITVAMWWAAWAVALWVFKAPAPAAVQAETVLAANTLKENEASRSD